MPTDTSPPEKPKLDRKILEKCGIIYSEHVYSPAEGGEASAPLPDNVESLREALLDFGTHFPESMKPFFDEEHKKLGEQAAGNNVLPPESAYFPVPSYKMESDVARIDAAGKKAEDSKRVAETSREYAKESESTWNLFLRNNIFKTFRDSEPSREKHDRLFDAWYIEQDFLWNEVKNFRTYNGFKTMPTGPKPDLTYGIPITSDAGISSGFQDHESVTNFSISVLRELFQSRGLFFSPVNGVAGSTRDKDHRLGQMHLFCYCQAANGASAALTLLENLYKKASLATEHRVERIPPVITFTCIGPEIKVWLAFVEVNKDFKPVAHKMVCIWASTLNATWGVMATRQIVKSMIIWVSRLLRPQISSCISQIRFRSQETESTRESSGAAFTSENHSATATGLATPSRNPQVLMDMNESNHSRAERKHMHNTNRRKSLFLKSRRGVDRSTSTAPPPPDSDSVFIEVRKGLSVNRKIPIRVRLPKVDHRGSPNSKVGHSEDAYNNSDTVNTPLGAGKTPLGSPSPSTESRPRITSPLSGRDRSVPVASSDNTFSNKSNSQRSLEERPSPVVDLTFVRSDDCRRSDMKFHGTTGLPIRTRAPNRSLKPRYSALAISESTSAGGCDAATSSDSNDRGRYYTRSKSVLAGGSTQLSGPLSGGGDTSSGTESNSCEDVYGTDSGDDTTKPYSEEESDDPFLEGKSQPSFLGKRASFSQDDIDSLMSQNFRSLSGGQFIELRIIQFLINGLSGFPLLDATWRSFEIWEGRDLGHEETVFLNCALNKIHTKVVQQEKVAVAIREVHPEHIVKGERWEDLDNALQEVQKLNESHLRSVLRSALRCWSGEECRGILRVDIEELRMRMEYNRTVEEDAPESFQAGVRWLGTN